jgi:hypothetical protein
MTFAVILPIVLKYLPALIGIAEGLWSWKSKAGADKKEFVTNTLQTVVTAMQTESTGGQKETWSQIGPSVSVAIDAMVGVANAVGAFKDENAAISMGA